MSSAALPLLPPPFRPADYELCRRVRVVCRARFCVNLGGKLGAGSGRVLRFPLPFLFAREFFSCISLIPVHSNSIYFVNQCKLVLNFKRKRDGLLVARAVPADGS
jgi:hypothetical protein